MLANVVRHGFDDAEHRVIRKNHGETFDKRFEFSLSLTVLFLKFARRRQGFQQEKFVRRTVLPI